jgi:P-type conjugative transfer protein TrbG
MKRAVVAVGFALMLGGCGTQQRPAPPPLNLAGKAPAPKPEAPPPPTGAEILASQPSQVRDAIKEHEQNGKWPVYRTPGYVLYPYDEGPQPPLLDCAPLRTTDIQLQPGETITDVAMGDTERWMATPASSGDPRNPVPHLAVKPQGPGIATNLTIYTTKHIYHLLLRSRGHAMQEVEFYYPEEVLASMKAADGAATKGETVSDPPGDDTAAGVVKIAAVNPAELNFSYKIDGANVPFRPVRAFDDGSHVYIPMAPGMKTSEAPALLIAAGNGTQMVNYRVEGNYYVVDRLFNQAVLVSGVGRQQDRVTIAYAGEGR